MFKLAWLLIAVIKIEGLEDEVTIFGLFLFMSVLIEFSLSQAHSFLFIHWGIHYTERVTNIRAAVLIASVKTVVLSMLFFVVTIMGSYPEPNRDYKWICSMNAKFGENTFYFINLPIYLNFIFVIIIAFYNFKVARQVLNQQVVPIQTVSQATENSSSCVPPSIISKLKKTKNAKVFLKMNIATLLWYTPLVAMNTFWSFINITGEDCDSYKHSRTIAFLFGPLWFLHLITFPIIIKKKLERFYDQVIY